MTANNIIIASGTKPSIPKIFNIKSSNILTAKEILSLDKMPSSLLIIGGGVIGCEFASIFSSFGTKVVILELEDRLLPFMDKDISQELQKLFRRKKIKSLFSKKIDKVFEDEKGINVSAGDEEIGIFDKILLGTGSYADCSFILPKVNIKKTDKGFIKINDNCKTNIDNIYAIGDVTGKCMLAHYASYQAEIAVNNIGGKIHESSIDNINVPLAVFTDPEIACIGMTEQEAEKNKEIKIGKIPMSISGRARTVGEINGFVKIIAEKSTDKVLGIHICGHNASELIGQAAIYLNKKMKINDICDIIHTHPTISETIFEAALSSNRRAIHAVNFMA